MCIYDNSISDITNRIIQRDGIFDFDKCNDVMGVSHALTDRQLGQLNISSETAVIAKCHKQLDDLKFLSDDCTYRVGDQCYVKSKNRFGVIRKLITVDGGKYADLQFYEPHIIDNESMIPYAKSLSEDLDLTKLFRLSEPLVTAIEDSFTWFVSANIDDNCPWIDEHISL